MITSTRFSRFAHRAGRGDLWDRPGLTRNQRFAVVIAGLVALKVGEKRLVQELRELFEEACPMGLAEDIIRQMAAYTGYPNAAVAMAALDLALGASVAGPVAALPDAPGVPTDDERYEKGSADYAKLNPVALATIRSAFDGIAPDLANLTFRAFGDVFASSGQDLVVRQLATVAALACMGTAAPQLRFHYGAALHVGVTQEQLVEVVLLVQYLAGMPAAYNAIVELKAAIATAGEPPPYR